MDLALETAEGGFEAFIHYLNSFKNASTTPYYIREKIGALREKKCTQRKKGALREKRCTQRKF